MRRIINRINALLMVLFLIALCAAEPFASAAKKLPAPASIKITAPNTTIDKGKSMALSIAATPADCDKSVSWKSSKPSVAAVSSKGVVTARSAGTATISAISKVNSKVKASILLTVFDPKKPTEMTFNVTGPLQLDVGQTLTISTTVKPSTASQKVKWSSGNTAVASVSQGGKVTAKRAGAATITASHSEFSSMKKRITVNVSTTSAPKSLQVSVSTNELIVNDKARIRVATVPANASKMFAYASGNESVAVVDKDGVVTATGAGTVIITVVSQRNLSVKASIQLYIFDDPIVPSAVILNQTSLTMGEGDSYTLKPKIIPSSAPADVFWNTSDMSVATVTSEGRVNAIKAGQAVITCATQTGNKSASATITVMQTTLTHVLPEVITDINGISMNLAKIEAVRRSAINEVHKLQASASISASESNARQTAINRAFDMYAFPWMTESVEKYYNPQYPEKHYMPGIVYYGLQYIQYGNGYNNANRRYDKARVLSGRFFTSSGKGYFLRNHAVKLNGMYAGNDCSSFVSMSQFGTNSGVRSYADTTAIAIATYYRTVDDWNTLRPGDIIVKRGTHVAMVLYYADLMRTQLVLIHQGGLPNTINIIFNIEYTKEDGFIARRQSTFR